MCAVCRVTDVVFAAQAEASSYGVFTGPVAAPGTSVRTEPLRRRPRATPAGRQPQSLRDTGIQCYTLLHSHGLTIVKARIRRVETSAEAVM